MNMMKKYTYIALHKICLHHKIEESFLYDLEENDLIRLYRRHGQVELHYKDLPKLEKVLRLHRELDINLEGIHSVFHLLNKMEDLQEEVWLLRRRLERLEGH